MCGIAGRVNFASGAPVDPGTIAAMADLVAHRGPDAAGAWSDGPVGFSHRRLAVIDLSPLGCQPMRTPDGELTITFNGEIYNFRELRAELEGLGHALRSQSDTEIILAAYRQWGTACVKRLSGMFAFVLWDAANRRVVAARDRVGKKPLFYRIDRDGFAFASEPKAFLAEPSFAAVADPRAIVRYLSYHYVPGEGSAFAGVKKLPPAHTLVIEAGRVTVEPYWRLSYATQRAIGEREALEALDEHVRRAVKRRLISDVPIGAFLSGGVDSGLVVSYMAELLDAPVRTFSIGFGETAYNELPAARAVAAKYATDHREFVVQPDAVTLLPRLVWHYGEPYGDSSGLPTYVLAELTRQHVTVALNGDGGDEVFGGYERYVASALADRLGATPRAARQLAAVATNAVARIAPSRRMLRAHRFARVLAEPRPSRRYGFWMMAFTPEAKGRLCTPEFLAAAHDDSYEVLDRVFAASDATTLVEQVMDADVRTYLPDDLLVKVDIATMAHGLEARSPLLDPELMEFAASLPASFKVRGREKKVLLRRLAERRLPTGHVNLPKRGFAVPLDSWFRDELRSFTREVLLDGRMASRGYFQMREVERLVSEHERGRAAWHLQLWNLLMLELWHRAFIDVRASSPPPRPAAAL